MKNATETPATPAAVSYAPEVIADSSGQFIRECLPRGRAGTFYVPCIAPAKGVIERTPKL